MRSFDCIFSVLTLFVHTHAASIVRSQQQKVSKVASADAFSVATISSLGEVWPISTEAQLNQDEAQPLPTPPTSLTTGYYWMIDAKGINRTLQIHVPDGNGPFPVNIQLHGGGGPKSSRIVDGHMIVYPENVDGWNVYTERSKLDDAGFVGKGLVRTLKEFANVDGTAFKIQGNSNGAALANRIAIENDDPSITHILTSVSQLNAQQYHEGKFWIGTGSEYRDYTQISKSRIAPRKLLQLTGARDPTVECCGANPQGVSGDMLTWEKSAFVYAQAWGEDGPRQTPSALDVVGEQAKEVVYLDGQVRAVNFLNRKHNTPWVDMAADFFAQ